MASEGPVILSYHDTLLRKSDVALLQDGQWLNDNVISFWFEYLEHDLYKDVAESIAFLTPQVAQFIKSASESQSLVADVSAVLRSTNLTTKRLVLIPINDQDTFATTINGSHWSLLVFYSNNESFEHYDSFSGSVNRFHAEQIVNVIKPLLTEGHESDIELDLTEMPCTQQKNGYDCGIHLIMNAEAVCRKAFRGVQQHITDIASPMAIKQARGTLTELINQLRSK